MKLHEYQAKELFRRYSVPVPIGIMVASATEAQAAARKLGVYPLMVKAQIHAGGRGKSGAVRFATSEQEVVEATAAIISTPLITTQTGVTGVVARCVLVEQWVDPERELYLSILVDHASASLLIMASQAGGMDIEAVAAATPEQLIRVKVDPLLGIQPFHCRQLAFGLELPVATHRAFIDIVTRLFLLFMENDCNLLEINPLAITGAGHFFALDAKIDLDDNGLRRHPELIGWRDEGAEDPLELAAVRAGLNYINLGGNIGNLVNGAGLAMATMDLIKQSGGEPANFLDVGGGASSAMIEEGLRIILSDSKVKGVLINVFGGILRCDVLALGVIQAARNNTIKVPVVIRLEGTNVETGLRLLDESGLKFTIATDLSDAAEKISAIVKNGENA